MSEVKKINRTAPRAQRGAATLVVVLVLLFGGTVMAFFANRSFIFEQRTSANQYRSTKAFELAEAGVEWAMGKLNEGLPLAAAPGCGTVAAGQTFRERYATPTPMNPPANPTGFLLVNEANFPSCRFDAAGVATCSCPVDNALPSLGSPDQPRFGVRFVSLGAADPAAVEIIARGCTNGGTCDPGAASTDGGDATAVVRVLVKIVPMVTSGPAAALTAGAGVVTSGSLNVINEHQPSNGITIHAGTSVSTGSGTKVTTLFGTPPRASILDSDASLNYLSSLGEDAFFNAYFGETLTHYIADLPPEAKFSGCGVSANPCAAQIAAYLNTGVKNPRIYADGNVKFRNGTAGLGASLGAADNPVMLVSAGDIEFGGNLVAHGLFYAGSGSTNWDYSGSGTVTVVGAFITRGSFLTGASGTLNLVYDPSLWGVGGAPKGRLVRVPGSWRDKSGDF